MSVSYTALVTPAEVKRAAFGTLGNAINDEIDAESGDLYDGVCDIIDDVTGLIERYLNRQLIIRPQLLRFNPSQDWGARHGYPDSTIDDLLITAWARQWPVVEVVEIDSDAAIIGDMLVLSVSGSSDVEMLGYDPGTTLITDVPSTVQAFIGYRRADQGIGTPGSGDSWTEDLLLQSGLSTLTVTTDDVPLLPRAIRRAAAKIARFDIRTAMLGLEGLDSSAKQVDRMTVNLEKVRSDFIEEVLRTIHTHRFEPFGATA